MVAFAVLIALAALPLLLDLGVRMLRRRVRRQRWDGLPEHARDEPVRATKWARLRAAPDGRSATLSGLTLGGRYLVEDDAQCPRGCPEPGPGCECGFHALKPDAEPAVFGPGHRMLRATSVALDVELSGTVLEYELGYRAQHQRVLRVSVPRICASCARFGDEQPAVTLITIPPSFHQTNISVLSRHAGGREPWPVLEPACDLHRRSRSEVPSIDLADLAGLLGTEVAWDPTPADHGRRGAGA